MSNERRVLELIEEAISSHGGDLDGWTKLEEEELQLFDGRVTLRANIECNNEGTPLAVHGHLLATLHEYDDETLDACVFGLADELEAALGQVAVLWMSGVAGPIKSFLDNKPVCMTCQAGVADGDIEAGYAPGDYGLQNVRAYVGPSFGRNIEDADISASFDDGMPWFRWSIESAAPRRVHLAKATIESKGENGWLRKLEIDGHEVMHVDPDWPTQLQGPDFGYFIRYAVFELPRNSTEIQRRAELDRTIEHFIRNYSKFDDVDKLMEAMVREGFDVDLVHDVESHSTIAFGRMFFEPRGMNYPSTIIRARGDGRVELDVPLLSLPAYSRGRAIFAQMYDSLSKEEVQDICLYNAESHVILNAMDAHEGKIEFDKMTLYPLVVPDRNASSQTMDEALAKLNEMVDGNRPKKKKSWKFWK
mgnify:CR=1 FL=1